MGQKYFNPRRARAGWAAAMLVSTLTACTNGNSVFNNSDAGTRSQILEIWKRDYPETMPPEISVSDGVVSLSGTVATPQMRIDAVRDSWEPAATREVMNEIRVPGSTVLASRDTATTIKLRSRLTFDPDIASTNYSIETLGGTVFLMGVAQNQHELDRVLALAQGVAGKDVVNFVRLRHAA